MAKIHTLRHGMTIPRGPERSAPRVVSVQLHPLEYEADDVQFLLVGNRIGFQPLRDLQVLLRRGIAFKIPV